MISHEDRRRRYLNVWRQGMTLKEFSRATNLSLSGARSAAKRLGLVISTEVHFGSIEKINQAYHPGMNIEDLANIAGVTITNARYASYKLNLKLKRRLGSGNYRSNSVRDLNIAEALSKGCTLKQLSERYNISRERIRQIGAKQGVSALNVRANNIDREDLFRICKNCGKKYNQVSHPNNRDYCSRLCYLRSLSCPGEILWDIWFLYLRLGNTVLVGNILGIAGSTVSKRLKQLNIPVKAGLCCIKPKRRTLIRSKRSHRPVGDGA